MSSFSKASHGAFEALRAIRPFLSFTKHEEESDVRRLSSCSGVTTLVGSQEDELYPPGLAKTLRSAASFFYIRKYEATTEPDDSQKHLLRTPKRKGSVPSLRGLLSTKSISQFSRTSEESRARRMNQKDSLPLLRPPSYSQTIAPQLDVKIPESSLRERVGGLTSKSGTNLLDPSAFVLDDVRRNEDAEEDDPELLQGNVTFDPFIKVPSVQATPDPPRPSVTDEMPLSKQSPNGRRFPLRNRVNMKKSLDRLHAKISHAWSPAARSDQPAQSSSPFNTTTEDVEGNPPVGTMGPRDIWDFGRSDRQRRYMEAMQDEPWTESDDVTDVDLKLQRVHTHSPSDEKRNFQDACPCDHDALCHQEKSLRFALEANERNCGPVLDGLNFNLVKRSGLALPNSVRKSHSSSSTSLLDLPPYFPTLEAQDCRSHIEIDDTLRGRPVNRYPSARRSNSPLTSSRVFSTDTAVPSEGIRPAASDAMPLLTLSPGSLTTGQVVPEVLQPAPHHFDEIAQIGVEHLRGDDADEDLHKGCEDQDVHDIPGLMPEIGDPVHASDAEPSDYYDSALEEADLVCRSIELLSLTGFDGLTPDCNADFLKDWPCNGSIHDPSQSQYIEARDLEDVEREVRSYWVVMWKSRSQLQNFHRANGLGENLDIWQHARNSNDHTDIERQALVIFRKFADARREAHSWYRRGKDGCGLFTHFDEEDEEDEEQYGLDEVYDEDQEPGAYNGDDYGEHEGQGYDDPSYYHEGQEGRLNDDPCYDHNWDPAYDPTDGEYTEEPHQYNESNEYSQSRGRDLEDENTQESDWGPIPGNGEIPNLVEDIRRDQAEQHHEDQDEASPLTTNRRVQEIYDFTKLAEQGAAISEASSESSESVSEDDWL